MSCGAAIQNSKELRQLCCNNYVTIHVLYRLAAPQLKNRIEIGESRNPRNATKIHIAVPPLEKIQTQEQNDFAKFCKNKGNMLSGKMWVAPQLDKNLRRKGVHSILDPIFRTSFCSKMLCCPWVLYRLFFGVGDCLYSVLVLSSILCSLCIV